MCSSLFHAQTISYISFQPMTITVELLSPWNITITIMYILLQKKFLYHTSNLNFSYFLTSLFLLLLVHLRKCNPERRLPVHVSFNHSVLYARQEKEKEVDMWNLYHHRRNSHVPPIPMLPIKEHTKESLLTARQRAKLYAMKREMEMKKVREVNPCLLVS